MASGGKRGGVLWGMVAAAVLHFLRAVACRQRTWRCLNGPAQLIATMTSIMNTCNRGV